MDCDVITYIWVLVCFILSTVQDPSLRLNLGFDHFSNVPPLYLIQIASTEYFNVILGPTVLLTLIKPKLSIYCFGFVTK